VARTPAELTEAELAFLTDRHLATLTTINADGTPHVVPVGFSYDASTATARVICSEGTQKVVNVERNPAVALSQLLGGAWLTLQGQALVGRSAESVAEGVRRYAARYQEPRPNEHRVVLEIAVQSVLGRVRSATE
jgi:F420H(2)-dependent biliverdin reductase